jgi:hypothetical protein
MTKRLTISGAKPPLHATRKVYVPIEAPGVRFMHLLGIGKSGFVPGADVLMRQVIAGAR